LPGYILPVSGLVNGSCSLQYIYKIFSAAYPLYVIIIIIIIIIVFLFHLAYNILTVFSNLYQGKEIDFHIYIKKYISMYIQPDETLHSLFISGNFSTCFGWYLYPSSGAHTILSAATGIYLTVIATCYSSTIAAGSSNGVTNIRCCR
jgi:hypothetical protein